MSLSLSNSSGRSSEMARWGAAGASLSISHLANILQFHLKFFHCHIAALFHDFICEQAAEHTSHPSQVAGEWEGIGFYFSS